VFDNEPRTLSGTPCRRVRQLAAVVVDVLELHRFAAIAAHDLRNPLASISGAAALLVEDAETSAEPALVSGLAVLQRSADRQNLVSNAITFRHPGRACRVAVEATALPDAWLLPPRRAAHHRDARRRNDDHRAPAPPLTPPDRCDGWERPVSNPFRRARCGRPQRALRSAGLPSDAERPQPVDREVGGADHERQ
jgi:hypothetical protein